MSNSRKTIIHYQLGSCICIIFQQFYLSLLELLVHMCLVFFDVGRKPYIGPQIQSQRNSLGSKLVILLNSSKQFHCLKIVENLHNIIYDDILKAECNVLILHKQLKVYLPVPYAQEGKYLKFYLINFNSSYMINNHPSNRISL